MASFPPSLKSVKQFLLQAKKVEKLNPLVAYYCRMHALSVSMKLPKDVREADSALMPFVLSLMDELEAEKAQLSLDQTEDVNIVKAFANSIFDKADNDDRSGSASVCYSVVLQLRLVC